MCLHAYPGIHPDGQVLYTTSRITFGHEKRSLVTYHCDDTVAGATCSSLMNPPF